MRDYIERIVERTGKRLLSAEVFARVLTKNDDSGRHGVLVPSDAYSFFPAFTINDPALNATMEFPAFSAFKAAHVKLAYKYYERYPERRITKLDSLLNDQSATARMLVVIKAKHRDGTEGYYFDSINNGSDGRFDALFRLIFGQELNPTPGAFIVRPVESPTFEIDADLSELLTRFDEVNSRGWVDSLRAGDTGIGYTFENLIGVTENNDRTADFRGIEIKCKTLRPERISRSGKINLFQESPSWLQELSAKERIRNLGAVGDNGLYSCYSQLTTSPNNLGLLLKVTAESQRIDLQKREDALGFWSFARLKERLLEKHSRAVFVKARTRSTGGATQFLYEEVVYCHSPSMERFVSLVDQHNIVFEFTMSEKADGRIRNHGYPWRLVREEFLEQLFAFQAKVR